MASRSDLPILVLAAGQSSRMRGRDKLMEQIDGHPLIRRQVETAIAATDGQVVVALPPAPHPRHVAIADCECLPVPVPNAHEGMSESLRCALDALPSETRAAMIMLADLPELTSEDLHQVLGAVNLDSGTLIWRGTTEDGTPGHPIVVAASLFEDLKRLRGDTGGAPVLRSHRAQTEFIRLPGSRALCDLDTPEDWAAWRAARK